MDKVGFEYVGESDQSLGARKPFYGRLLENSKDWSMKLGHLFG